MIHDSALEAELSPLVIEASSEYVGRWNHLVSTTNWEKGRIITQWREALEQAGAPVAGRTDDVWAQQVGGVTPQHVGRLRRVYERFADSYQQYAGLYWSHFYSALDWPDAEMWLEGAVQNDWSITQMRNQRWESLGALPEQKPMESEIFAADSEIDEPPPGGRSLPDAISETIGEVHDAGEELGRSSRPAPFEDDDDNTSHASQSAESVTAFRPFENLPAMPADVNEAFELFKLAIIGRKLGGWQDIALDDLLAILDSLKRLALAPAE
jgi:hypothetical protein